MGSSPTEISSVTDWIKGEFDKFVDTTLAWLEERRKNYESNPYMKLKGFKISLTGLVLPTVELEFEFK